VLSSRLSEGYAMEDALGFPAGSGMTVHIIFLCLCFTLFLECISKAKTLASMMQQENKFYSHLAGSNHMKLISMTKGIHEIVYRRMFAKRTLFLIVTFRKLRSWRGNRRIR